MSPEQQGPKTLNLEARIAVLEELFVRLAQTGATESILGNGLGGITDSLDKIAEQLAPLRALGPDVPNLSVDQQLRIQHLKAALVSPDPTVNPTPPAEKCADSLQMRSAS